jgi:hypothetical protein
MRQDAPDERMNACLRLLQELARAVERYETDQGLYPPSGNDLLVRALLRYGYFEFAEESLNGRGQVVDPWGHPLVYKKSGRNARRRSFHQEGFVLYSLGPGGRGRIELDSAGNPPRRPRS